MFFLFRFLLSPTSGIKFTLPIRGGKPDSRLTGPNSRIWTKYFNGYPVRVGLKRISAIRHDDYSLTCVFLSVGRIFLSLDVTPIPCPAANLAIGADGIPGPSKAMFAAGQVRGWGHPKKESFPPPTTTHASKIIKLQLRLSTLPVNIALEGPGSPVLLKAMFACGGTSRERRLPITDRNTHYKIMKLQCWFPHLAANIALVGLFCPM